MFTNSILTTESYARTLLCRSTNREAYTTEAVAVMMIFQLQKLQNSSHSVSVWLRCTSVLNWRVEDPAAGWWTNMPTHVCLQSTGSLFMLSSVFLISQIWDRVGIYIMTSCMRRRKCVFSSLPSHILVGVSFIRLPSPTLSTSVAILCQLSPLLVSSWADEQNGTFRLLIGSHAFSFFINYEVSPGSSTGLPKAPRGSCRLPNSSSTLQMSSTSEIPSSASSSSDGTFPTSTPRNPSPTPVHELLACMNMTISHRRDQIYL